MKLPLPWLVNTARLPDGSDTAKSIIASRLNSPATTESGGSGSVTGPNGKTATGSGTATKNADGSANWSGEATGPNGKTKSGSGVFVPGARRAKLSGGRP